MEYLIGLLLVICTRFSLTFSAFSPIDNYLISCGSTKSISFQGQLFNPDWPNPPNFSLKAAKYSSSAITNPNSNLILPSPLYQSLRVFTQIAQYQFDIHQPGRHWIRLHFYPLPNSTHDLLSAPLTVLTDDCVLMNNFVFKNSNCTFLFKEFSIITSGSLSLFFVPSKGSVSFINAIEIVSAPDSLIDDEAVAIPSESSIGLLGLDLETVYRLNMGGPVITPLNDTLGRYWEHDSSHLHVNSSAVKVSVDPIAIKYPSGLTTEIAPAWIYATAEAMGDPNITDPDFNITWVFTVDPAFQYLLRMHFCDIISKALNMLFFNVYVNYDIAIQSLDLSSLKGGLSVPYYQDIISNSSNGSSTLTVSIGPDNAANFISNAILNGLEIMKISSEFKALDGNLSVHDILPDLVRPGKRMKRVQFVMALAFGSLAVALALVVFRYYCLTVRQRKALNHSHPWLPLPLIGSSTSHASSKLSMVSNRSGTASCISLASTNLGQVFTFQEIMFATNKFDETLVLGVGGFGKVYKGTLQDGTTIAVKRGNSRSEQGLSEFHTEIEMLSKLRHRHLVSLIGYCNERSEMILVYEYMANGPLRSHLYGSGLKPLSWRQRLEICIGAARGLHYLHTGATRSIIHRDVKTTNILLDESFVAKVADFGLSKAGPALDQNQTHVSTAVKGSFGYLDPEYFRRQQLTEKSDVYSFGVVLLEVLCARPALNPVLPREQVNIAEWAMAWQKKGKLDQIVDPILSGKISVASLKKYGETAEKCLADHGSDRPGMGDVLWNLEYVLQLEETSVSLTGRDVNSINSVHGSMMKEFFGDNSVNVSDVGGGSRENDTSSSVFSQIVNPKGR